MHNQYRFNKINYRVSETTGMCMAYLRCIASTRTGAHTHPTHIIIEIRTRRIQINIDMNPKVLASSVRLWECPISYVCDTYKHFQLRPFLFALSFSFSFYWITIKLHMKYVRIYYGLKLHMWAYNNNTYYVLVYVWYVRLCWQYLLWSVFSSETFIVNKILLLFIRKVYNVWILCRLHKLWINAFGALFLALDSSCTRAHAFLHISDSFLLFLQKEMHYYTLLNQKSKSFALIAKQSNRKKNCIGVKMFADSIGTYLHYNMNLFKLWQAKWNIMES